jgi:multidrug efflux pump subunit AcrA (membrane-fusion protein)
MSPSDELSGRSLPARQLATSTVLAQALPSVLILAGGVAAFLALSKWLHEEPPTVSEAATAPIVKTATVREHHDGLTIKADGVVVPYREIDLSAEVAGRVVERADVCRAGNYVTRGTLLARIDPQDYQLEKERLEKERQQASVALEELAEELAGSEQLIQIAEKQLVLRGKELTRMQRLGRAVSTTELEQTEAAELTARDTLLQLKNQVRLLKVREGRLKAALDLAASKLAKAELDLARTEIVAPVDGIIVADRIEQDAFVQRGTSLVTIEDTSKVEVKCKLNMADLFWLWDRQPSSEGAVVGDDPADAYQIPETPVDVVYRLVGRDNSEFTWSGHLSRYDGFGLDEKTRTVPCRVVVDNPRERASAAGETGPPVLLRGMYVTIRIQVDPRTPLLRVSEPALRPGNVVWRVRENRVSIVPVRFVTMVESASAHDSGIPEALIYVDAPDLLAAGELVVTSPLTFVRSGMEVQVSAPKEP